MRRQKQSINKIVTFLLNQRYFNGNNQTRILTHYEKGTSKVLIVTGENAEGKSFFSRLFHEYCTRFLKTDCLRTGMDVRTERSFATIFSGYREEAVFSTGHSSVDSIISGIDTCKKMDSNHYIIFDEPTVGLSEGYQYAAGLYFAEFMKNCPKNTLGVVVITHSRLFVEPLLAHNPQHLRFGDNTKLKDWVEQTPAKHTIEELLQLPEKGICRLRDISHISDKIKSNN